MFVDQIEQKQDNYETWLARSFAELNEDKNPVLGADFFATAVMMMLFLISGNKSIAGYYFRNATNDDDERLSAQQLVATVRRGIDKNLSHMTNPTEKALFVKLLAAMDNYASTDTNAQADAKKFFVDAAKFCSISSEGIVEYAAKLLESITNKEITDPNISYYYLKQIRANTKLAAEGHRRYDHAFSDLPYDFYTGIYHKALTALAMHPMATIQNITEYATIAPEGQYMDLIQDAESILNKNILSAIGNSENIANVVELAYTDMRILLAQMMRKPITEEQKAMIKTFYDAYSSDAAHDKIFHLLSPQPVEYIKQTEQTAQNRVLELEAENARLREENAKLQQQLQEQSEQYQDQEQERQQETERRIQEIESKLKMQIEELEKERDSLADEKARLLSIWQLKIGILKLFFETLKQAQEEAAHAQSKVIGGARAMADIGENLLKACEGLEIAMYGDPNDSQRYDFIADMEKIFAQQKHEQMVAQGKPRV